ncbi:MAG: hypothetical protein ACI87H_002953 [Gammaproteobacteria bacterium]|jgi:hypothetical protein
MKIFFALLLIVNIAFAVFQWLIPYEQLFVENKSTQAAEQLALLSENSVEPAAKAEIVAAASSATASTQSESSSAAVVAEAKVAEQLDPRLCYTIGPFKDKTRAQQVAGRYQGGSLKTDLKSSQEKEYLGVMVFIDGHKTREDAVKTAQGLAAKGIKDNIIINRPSEEILLSLGVFGLKKNAETHKARIEKLGYKVKTESRYRERTIYWIYNEQTSDIEQQNLLKTDDRNSGISQIGSQCL